MADNPWLVDSIEVFYYLKCPECPFDTQTETIFHEHAIANHPLSSALFGKQYCEYNIDDPYETKIEISPNNDTKWADQGSVYLHFYDLSNA